MNLFGNDMFCKRIIKSSGNLNMFLAPSLKKCQESLSRMPDNYFQRLFSSLGVHHLAIQRNFEVFPKIKASNMFNPFHDVIIIPETQVLIMNKTEKQWYHF